jgi:hypothetical protein
MVSLPGLITVDESWFYYHTPENSLTTMAYRVVSELMLHVLKDGLVRPSGSYQKGGSGALTSVGSMLGVLKFD